MRHGAQSEFNSLLAALPATKITGHRDESLRWPAVPPRTSFIVYCLAKNRKWNFCRSSPPVYADRAIRSVHSGYKRFDPNTEGLGRAR